MVKQYVACLVHMQNLIIRTRYTPNRGVLNTFQYKAKLHGTCTFLVLPPKQRQWALTCSSSCLSLISWASSCLLWSSKICIRASSRPLCCRNSLASATISWSRLFSPSLSSRVYMGECSKLSCCACRKRSYSTCRFLAKHQGRVVVNNFHCEGQQTEGIKSDLASNNRGLIGVKDTRMDLRDHL